MLKGVEELMIVLLVNKLGEIIQELAVMEQVTLLVLVIMEQQAVQV
tara:strand:+ start:426 stop:563 length:138 start_codon:yes stop_codon:yes gene_type:complete